MAGARHLATGRQRRLQVFRHDDIAQPLVERSLDFILHLDRHPVDVGRGDPRLGQRRRILIGTVVFFTVIIALTMLTWLLVFPRLHRWIENADVASSIPRQAVIEDCQRMLRDSGRLSGQIMFEDRDLNVGNNDARWWVDGEVIVTDAGGVRNRKFYSCSMRYLDRKPQLDLLEIH